MGARTAASDSKSWERHEYRVDDPSEIPMTIPHSRFAVDETPYCVWEHDLRDRNLTFLKQLDPKFFEYLADAHWHDGDPSQHAALALRVAYGHGLETLFAMISATVQAPDCVVGWLQRYSYSDVESIIEKIRSGAPILSKLRGREISWETIAAAVHSPMQQIETEKRAQIARSFGRCWAGMSFDLLDPIAHKEFNSIKHGCRVSPGGFTLAFGLEDVPGVAAPPERMEVLGASRFGSSFFVPENLHNRRHFRVRSHSRNWCPENLAWGLKLIALSLNNIVAYLRIVNGEKGAEFRWPQDEQVFEAYRALSPGVTSTSMDSVVTAAHAIDYSPDEILAIYRDSDEDDAAHQ
jgi:hypothetical protein